jgi:hypothetical protein
MVITTTRVVEDTTRSLSRPNQHLLVKGRNRDFFCQRNEDVDDSQSAAG